MRVLIVGCGYVGMALGQELVRQGHSVFGLRRSPESDHRLAAVGIQPIHADITLPASLPDPCPRYDWVVNCVSASGGGAGDYQRIYLEGMRNVLSWLSSAAPTTFLYTSSTSVYGQAEGQVVDESSPTTPISPTSRVLVQTEQVLLRKAHEAALRAVVLRVAGIYGPGRAYWLDQVRSGVATIEQDGGRFLNMIHRDDVVGAIIASLTHSHVEGVFNVVDNEPVAQSVLVCWLANRLGCSIASTSSETEGRAKKRGTTSKKVSNLRLKTALRYQFRFPTFREGYASLIDR